jgi:hypothetical protein
MGAVHGDLEIDLVSRSEQWRCSLRRYAPFVGFSQQVGNGDSEEGRL